MDKRIFVYGFGNPGRRDDGLGPALVSMVEEDGELSSMVETDSNYQLNVEDALTVSACDAVIFADATVSEEHDVHFREIEASADISFTTHSMSPESVLALCRELYNPAIRGYVLAMRGYEWDLAEGLSPSARENLAKAFGLLKCAVKDILGVLDREGSRVSVH